jgi:hypothetical protein
MEGDPLADTTRFSDGLIRSLEQEWRGVATRRVDVAEWESALDSVAEKYAEIRARGAWVSGRADFFGILGLGRAELTHSAMLAWLFDPEGRHGFGRRFLDQLIASHIHDLDPNGFRVRDVVCEVQVLETRADIVVWGDTATIVVEVKVDAGEGWRQCDRLYERFSDNPDPRFIFLTPSGRAPLTATGYAADDFTSISFEEVRVALEAVLDGGTTGDGVRAAFDYAQTLKEEF